jgi:1-acyl-sn-glycerol-3-phosphate acyltransferase
VLLTRLGIERVWGGGPEGAWAFMRHWMVPTILRLAPGSFAYGVERVPADGGAVLAANHLSALDPPLIGIFCRRAVWYMMKAELAGIPVVGEALTWTGAFPIRRGESDREGLRRARELVRAGHVVGIFPEGTRQRLGFPGPVQPGAVMIAMHENAPVVPVGLDSFGWSRGSRRACCVVFGEPMRHTGRGYRHAAELLEAELLRLWRQAAEAVAAGFPPNLPDGTARAGPIRPGDGFRVEGGIRNVRALDPRHPPPAERPSFAPLG